MLSKEQLSFYAQNGYLLLDEVFTPEEIDECSLEYDKLFRAKENENNLEAKWKGDWTAPSTDSLKVITRYGNVNSLIFFTFLFLRCYQFIICNVTLEFLRGCFSIIG